MPTVIFYGAEINRHANLIGKFDKDSISEHEGKFKDGKLPLQDAKVPQKEMILSDITDCPSYVLETVEDDDDFDEILAEILAEEEARKAAEDEDEDTGYGGKKKKKKKDTKKKKKKKAGERDEL